MPELLPDQHRAMALAELERIEQTLSEMSQWVDGDAPDREKASVLLEDAARAVAAAGWALERASRSRVADLAHRRTGYHS